MTKEFSRNRELMVEELHRTIYGPYFGPYEILPRSYNPQKLYITGVLGPKEYKYDISKNLDTKINPHSTETPISFIKGQDYYSTNRGDYKSSELTDISADNDEEVGNPPKFISGLDSKSKPRSFGISFLVKNLKKESSIPTLDLCVTWARYKWYENMEEIKDIAIYNNPENITGPNIGEKEISSDQTKMEKQYKGDKSKRKKESEKIFSDPSNLFDKELLGIEIQNPKKMAKKKYKKKIKIEENEPQEGNWCRDPRFLIINRFKLDIKDDFQYFSQKDINDPNPLQKIHTNIKDSEKFKLAFKIEQLKNKLYRISIYFINDSVKKKKEKNEEKASEKEPYDGKWIEDYVFQPQIRIKIDESFRKVPYEFFGDENDDTNIDETLVPFTSIYDKLNNKLLYHKKRPYAEGHLCSVFWKEVDPERNGSKKDENGINRKITSKYKQNPFYWEEKQIILDHDPKLNSLLSKFSVADLRTEFIPVYPINAPNFDWRWDNKKFLNPEYLAENIHDASKIKTIFSPLIHQYEKWISLRNQEIDKLHTDFRKVAEENLKLHDQVIERIKAGIEVLEDDVDARLSFCFANKAIIKQYEMANDSFYPWRPFQIGFLLMLIKDIVDKKTDIEIPINSTKFRDFVDLIWVPTGGGKTEAYLLLSAFTLAYRARISQKGENSLIYQMGTKIISRYTLRLLTIQQFRRALRLVVACELLRLEENSIVPKQIGWLPKNIDKNKLPKYSKNWIWGGVKFSIGLWIGGAMTPNHLNSWRNNYGAINILDAPRDTFYTEGNPAQIVECPACGNILALPHLGQQYLPQQKIKISTMIQDIKKRKFSVLKSKLKKKFSKYKFITDFDIDKISQNHDDIYRINFKMDMSNKRMKINKYKKWWQDISISKNILLLATSPVNPGYFFKKTKYGGDEYNYDFEIRCVDPDCELMQSTFKEEIYLDGKLFRRPVNPIFQHSNDDFQSIGVPIHALTVDQQIYRNPPSIIIATVDKFAQITYNENIGNIFGKISRFNEIFGFMRERNYIKIKNKQIKVKDFHNLSQDIPPPEFIIQDELHLIEGPLGSYTGFYESAIENLCQDEETRKYFSNIKYIASTATIKSAKEQVQSLYTRKLFVFPPPGIDENDNFFQYSDIIHPLDEDLPGRLYVGIATPGKSSQSSLKTIFGALLQEANRILLKNPEDPKNNAEIDRFWTLVSYFNTIKELATISSVCNQDLRLWMNFFYPKDRRKLPYLTGEDPLELSGRIDSLELPQYLKRLENGLVDKNGKLRNKKKVTNIVLTTSMFGTGVDVSRLGLMVINGQPKTTSQYIQASGRIGRSKGGIIVTFLHAGRPRDLDHYEKFVGYHQSLYKYVESSSVFPFAPNCMENLLGPIAIALFRQGRRIGDYVISHKWRDNQKGPKHIKNDKEIFSYYKEYLKQRYSSQPKNLQISPDTFNDLMEKFDTLINKWESKIEEENYRYNQWFFNKSDKSELPYSVLLPREQHKEAKKENLVDFVFPNAIDSFRGVEPTICVGFHVEGEAEKKDENGEDANE